MGSPARIRKPPFLCAKEECASVRPTVPPLINNSAFNNNPGYQKPYGDPGNGDYVDTHIYVGPYGASVPDGKRAASLGEFGGSACLSAGICGLLRIMPTITNQPARYLPTSIFF
jgi:hypothetical protein